MDPDITAHLRCPVCRGELAAGPAAGSAALGCPAGHRFDLARQGYANLTAGRAPHTGDTAAMVAARADFLRAGHFGHLSAALAAAAARAVGELRAAPGAPRAPGGGRVAPPLVVDAGAGTGHHLAAVLDAVPAARGLALDASKPALRRAARAHPRAAAALADTWGRLPLADGCAAVLLDVFAPRNGPEFRRVLAPGGTLLVVTPEPAHLAEVVAALDLLRVDPDKPARLVAGLPGFAVGAGTVHTADLALTHAEVAALVAMGPSAWHTDPAARAARLAALPPTVHTRASVRLTAFRPV
ncbi:ubiquinone biosynthesis protein [Pilimelia terevasa]|uniref:Ubiquinone biosynthesis protein n=1 Tax=Pilimelia terevasa TaxID=53372 RepID=A0A8J3BSH8_9ACTN|nr:23S rRNA methyltransferase [Pilimelia terevasa]GGK30812.1 ubiquinone biosynthesis protein [Pilimelia terevasa]